MKSIEIQSGSVVEKDVSQGYEDGFPREIILSQLLEKLSR